MDYVARLKELRVEHDVERRAYSRTVQWLAAVAAVAVTGAWIAIAMGYAGLAPLSPLAALIPAWFLLRRMKKIGKRSRELRLLCSFYERGLERHNHQWMNQPETGEEYADANHLYSSDLDLFGRGSLFQLLCIARTGVGRDSLARWMKEIASTDEAKARSEAVQELRDLTDLRESIASVGADSSSDCQTESFTDWLEAPARRFPGWAQPAAFLLPLGIPLFIFFAATGTIAPGSFVLFAPVWLVLAGGFTLRFRKRVNSVIGDIGMPAVDLSILAEMIAILERQAFRSVKLCALAEAVCANASQRVSRLRRMVKLLEFGRNYFEPIGRFFLLWDAQFAIIIESWRQRHGDAMKAWLAAIGEFECFNAISTYAFENPEDIRAEFVEGSVGFEAIGLGHPLLDAQRCVRNDVRLGDETPLWIVSGSNMSGKSTLLRACGLAMVLASMGAPVRAQQFRVSNLTIAASIGTGDSLLDGKSKFFVEVERLKRMIELATNGRRVLFLVDEMLGGTNSQDRGAASEAVVRALLEGHAIGLITTHDLALTRMGVRARNVHFADSADSGGLDFDYRLRPGVIEKSNALAIVRMLGIPLG